VTWNGYPLLVIHCPASSSAASGRFVVIVTCQSGAAEATEVITDSTTSGGMVE
jgi:hypothetical protein